MGGRRLIRGIIFRGNPFGYYIRYISLCGMVSGVGGECINPFAQQLSLTSSKALS